MKSIVRLSIRVYLYHLNKEVLLMRRIVKYWQYFENESKRDMHSSNHRYSFAYFLLGKPVQNFSNENNFTANLARTVRECSWEIPFLRVHNTFVICSSIKPMIIPDVIRVYISFNRIVRFINIVNSVIWHH